MLTHIGVASENAFRLPILGVSMKESLLVRTITGLNPPDVDLFIGDYSRDGGFYQGRRVGKRNVVMTIDLNPNPAFGETVSGLRDLLYKAFIDPQVDGDFIELVLYDDVGRELYLVGYTEKMETDIFSNETTVMISMICPDPYIRNVIPSFVQNDPGWVSVPFQYQGTAETGFEVELEIKNTISQLVLVNNNKTMVVAYPFTPGQIVYINTTRGSTDIQMAVKADWVEPQADVSGHWALLEEELLTTPLIAGLDPNSRWIELHSQSNSMSVYGDTPNDAKVVIRSLAYREAFWGV